MNTIDLRSDTVTIPTPAMLQAMMSASVGDDVYGEDPTVNALQEKVSALFGKESALFVPSGTMGNQVSIKTHTEPGDEVIVEEEAHVFVYETAGPAILSAVQLRTVRGTRGMLSADQIRETVRPPGYHLPRTRLLCLENTHGRSGGVVLPVKDLRTVSDYARGEGLKIHLDGARIWNASVASGVALRDYGSCFDSLSVCFSKGLGAPVGSMIVGDRAFIDRARHFRKIFGGGMRQAGFLAAAATYALDHNIARLADDHKNARWFAESLMGLSQLEIDLDNVQTNMVIMDVKRSGRSQREVLELLAGKGVLLTPERHSGIRAVTHLNVSRTDVETASKVFHSIFQ